MKESSKETPTIRKVFISHKSSDAQWARTLAENLRKNGIYAWLDIWDMPPGQPSTDAMQEGIEGCHDMVVVLSKASVAAIRTGEGGVAFEVHVGKNADFVIHNFGLSEFSENIVILLRSYVIELEGGWISLISDPTAVLSKN